MRAREELLHGLRLSGPPPRPQAVPPGEAADPVTFSLPPACGMEKEVEREINLNLTRALFLSLFTQLPDDAPPRLHNHDHIDGLLAVPVRHCLQSGLLQHEPLRRAVH